MNYYYVLPSGTEIRFPDCPHNHEVIGANAVDITFGRVYTIEGVDWDGYCYFIDNEGEKNYAGMASDFTDGIMVIV